MGQVLVLGEQWKMNGLKNLCEGYFTDRVSKCLSFLVSKRFMRLTE